MSMVIPSSQHTHQYHMIPLPRGADFGRVEVQTEPIVDEVEMDTASDQRSSPTFSCHLPALWSVNRSAALKHKRPMLSRDQTRPGWVKRHHVTVRSPHQPRAKPHYMPHRSAQRRTKDLGQTLSGDRHLSSAGRTQVNLRLPIPKVLNRIQLPASLLRSAGIWKSITWNENVRVHSQISKWDDPLVG